MNGLKILNGKNGTIFKAVMNAIIPRGGAFAPGAADFDLLPRADRLLMSYEPAVKALFPLMLRYVHYGALVRTGRVFTRLNDEKGAAYLAAMEHSPFFYRRLVLLLMKLLTMLVFYERDDMALHTGYVHGCGETGQAGGGHDKNI
jgi:hypothetical protein